MVTLFYQTSSDIPNSIPVNFRSNETLSLKSVMPMLTEICGYLNIPIRQVTKDQWKGEIAYYHIEIAWIDQAMIYRNIFEWIDDDVLNLIKDRTQNLRLLLWFPTEGFSLSMPRFIEIIDFCIKDLFIPPEKVYFVFGDINIEKNYERWKSKWSLSPINVYGFDSFEASYHNECRMLESDGYIEMFPRDEDRIKNLNKFRKKRFIFRNANPRKHRLYFAAQLKSKGLLEKSFYSWLNRYHKPSPDTYDEIIRTYSTDLSTHYDLKNHMIDFMDNSPYIVDYDASNIGDDLNQRILQPNMFIDSYFTFVTETTFDNHDNENVLFLTEKIYQPIVQYHPFIIAACPGTLEYMRNYGYKTFPELFDEEYDIELDLKQRTRMILDNIERVSNMEIDKLNEIYYSDHFQEKLIHNKNLFVLNKGKSKWESAIKWLDR